jgi:3-isopropylmalate/(R)-2-methylmalate dehydratase small subunit
MTITGKVWKFGDNINTDLILPMKVYYLTPQEQTRYVFEANRPGWADEVEAGDIIIGGRNFGMGSSRPAARSLKNLAIGCLLAESINGLFYRNCVNWGFPALEVPGVEAAFDEGDTAEIAFDDFAVRNATTGAKLRGIAVPDQLLKVFKAGGIYPLLEAEGLIAPAPPA